MDTIRIFARLADKISQPKKAYAHCDIPCGIYDPHLAQVAAHTVARMMQLIAEHKDAHSIARYTAVKEEHAEICKHEIRIIWGDYFKPEMIAKHPETHELVFKIMKAGSKARQGTDMAAADELIELVNQFAEIFWETKGINTRRAKTPYEPKKEFAMPEL